jgi:hypothetical protein
LGIGTFVGLGMKSNLGMDCMKNWPRNITNPVNKGYILHIGRLEDHISKHIKSKYMVI